VTDLADFLRARLLERRALAEAASPGLWSVNAESDEVVAIDGITVADGFALSGRQLRATTAHIAANDPKYVLADIDAKLALLDDFLAEYHHVCGDKLSAACGCSPSHSPNTRSTRQDGGHER
jgi:hypothetical protein